MGRRNNNTYPWEIVTITATACFVTLVGVAGGLEPFVILRRVCISGLVVAITVLLISQGVMLVRNDR